MTVKTKRTVGFKVGLSSSKKASFICIKESTLKMMKNAFYFILKGILFFKIFKLVEKWLDKEGKAKFKTYDVINWETNNYNTHISHYLKK